MFLFYYRPYLHMYLFVLACALATSLMTLAFPLLVKKDPDTPYIRQHYARMYDRSGVENTALRTIDEAIEMSSSIRSLYHTKGYIFHHMAMSAERRTMD
jgi:hypothetical protein